MWFAKYLFARLEDEKKKRAGLSTVIHVRTLIQNVSLGATHGWVLTDSLGVQYQANKVILALGLPNVSWPRGIAGIENSRQAVPQSMHVDSWSEQALKHVTSVSKILLLGSGLTTVDTILSLRSNGAQAPITVLSRHGRFPTPHFISPAPSALTLQAPLPKTLKNVMKKFRELSSEYRWDAVIDAFRPHIPDIWSDFTQKEQDRFRRHIQPLWDIHRHRMAPKIWENIATQLKKGDLCVVAGRLKKVEPVGRQIAATFQRRRRAVTENEQFDFVINCTGFGTLDGASYGGLLSRLIEQKIVTLDPTGTGVRTVAKNTFRLAKDMYVLGALLRAERWESIAVPELRQQASDIARQCFV